MSSGRDKVDCENDGEGYESWVCQHLFDNPAQAWFSRDPTSANPWPDAWCASCDNIFLRDGAWTDDNSACTGIKLICHYCYERRRTQEI